MNKAISSLLLLFLLINLGKAQDQMDNNYMFHSALKDKSGNLWFATTGLGVYRYDAASGALTLLTEQDGLCHNNVSSILQDKKGNLWIGSDAGSWGSGGGGLCRYDPVSGSCTRFTTTEGLTNPDVWTVVEDNEGNIWVGTRGGLYRYHSASGRFIDYTHKATGNH